MYSLCNLCAKSIYTGNGGILSILLSPNFVSLIYPINIPKLNPAANPPVTNDPIPRASRIFFIYYGHL
ncbi:hypothetical protein APZ24_gp182 [Ostreococcus lucimarinus virus 2]|uniref:hypothetical protein n=1 Tax=Ostreococcus tauri virus 2 TaxID=696472 RepID=UPI0001EF46B9|nr:hypothetical protein OtV2_232 [Ostreococcus tauri virus 2]YP_009172757.1 hypothetical protein APZ24_gp182 [Ostreococcus lucimarinus virus 2]ALI95629.1 hypothetical protein OlV2_266 [Ostreococcus lucimarinus virus 2]CBI70231.1 hypothetical protein OtV2_232 [Ostreococcus tauri virus 2]